MQALLDVILPVFLVIGGGYVAVWKKVFSEAAADGLNVFTQNFAIPCLLFQAISNLDLSAEFNLALLGSFYFGATSGFFAGLLGARFVFKRSWTDAVAIGFCCLFSNSVLLGLPIMERAYGVGSLESNFAIIALHAPFCYLLGVTAMEIARNQSHGLIATTKRIFGSMFHNALVIGIGLGFLVNLTGLPIPGVVASGVDLMSSAALPAALFGLGGVLVRYKPEGDSKVIAMVCFISLILHPTIVFFAGSTIGLDRDGLRSAVVTASMAPGISTYLFANMFGAARRVAASAVLMSTALSIFTVWIWLSILP